MDEEARSYLPYQLYSYSVIDFEVSFFYSWLVSFLHYISLDFHLQCFASFFLCSDFSSNCLFWDDEDGVTVVDVSSLFSVVPKTATYRSCLVAACMVMFFCKLLHPVHRTSC